MTATFGGEEIGAYGIVRGAYAKGIRCRECNHMILECASCGGESGPSLDLIKQVSDLERDGKWDQALAMYRRVPDEPDDRSHHEYARNGIKLS